MPQDAKNAFLSPTQNLANWPSSTNHSQSVLEIYSRVSIYWPRGQFSYDGNLDILILFSRLYLVSRPGIHVLFTSAIFRPR